MGRGRALADGHGFLMVFCFGIGVQHGVLMVFCFALIVDFLFFPHVNLFDLQVSFYFAHFILPIFAVADVVIVELPALSQSQPISICACYIQIWANCVGLEDWALSMCI